MRMNKKINKTNLIFLITTIIILKIIYTRIAKLNVQTAWQYIEIDDGLAPIENHRYFTTRDMRHIYFHHTSDLDAYQMCVVESAARTHYDWQINVIFSGLVNSIERLKKHFLRFGNVKFWRMRIDKYLHNTSLEHLVDERILQTSQYLFTQTREVVRYVTLYKWDGVYLDLNMLIVKSLNDLPMNFATRKIYPSVSDGILRFSNDKVGRHVADAAMRDVANTFNTTVNLNNGTGTMTRVLTERCKLFDNTLGSVYSCNGFYVFAPNYFCTITWRLGAKFSLPSYILNNFSYGYHLGDDTNFRELSLATKTAIYNILARLYCPYTYQIFKEDFLYPYY
ncbi:lactosylceramide 4-alpha-galactosyltransferase-like [Hyposmocoma kahamanoa]|uniref:lactosylceramide 4-alpha-galactosyltransferase-like n=1 Tax=Hyposmocoma kahamanoa TaxID=1477025 RepID=UPI000E6D8A00|nr:lactosylceramide 4-alpha-galactosyltransferase-like [Hyposmocoma kahamanoa]